MINRRQWILSQSALMAAAAAATRVVGQEASHPTPELAITDITVTPIALPDPPLLAASGCHGPYFLLNIVQIKTDAGIVGAGETHGSQGVTEALLKASDVVLGQSAFAYSRFSQPLRALSEACYAGIELACLDA
ncbi:MAG: hypothetical protein ACREHD_26435, partial [Pirellulales bacterium]